MIYEFSLISESELQIFILFAYVGDNLNLPATLRLRMSLFIWIVNLVLIQMICIWIELMFRRNEICKFGQAMHACRALLELSSFSHKFIWPNVYMIWVHHVDPWSNHCGILDINNDISNKLCCPMNKACRIEQGLSNVYSRLHPQSINKYWCINCHQLTSIV